jgi:peroxiredoxin
MKKYAKGLVFLAAVLCFAFSALILANKLAAQNPEEPKKAAVEDKAMQQAMEELAAQPKAPEKKELAPDFSLQEIHQDIYTLSQYRGKKPVILFFWTTWCPYCQRELTLLNDMYAGLVKDGFQVLAINAGEFPDTVQNYVQNYYLAYPVLMDKDNSVTFSYALLGIPTYIIVDKEGYIVFKDNYFPQKEYKDLVEE